MMGVKKNYLPKSNNEEVSKLSTDFKNTITKLMDEIKNKDK